jgi:hypothetical protein
MSNGCILHPLDELNVVDVSVLIHSAFRDGEFEGVNRVGWGVHWNIGLLS